MAYTLDILGEADRRRGRRPGELPLVPGLPAPGVGPAPGMGVEDRDPRTQPIMPTSGGAPALAVAGAEAIPAPPRPGTGTGFVNLDRVFALNQGAGQQVAQGLVGDVQQRAASAHGGTDASEVAARARTLGSGGAGTLLAEQASRQGPYSAGMQSMDAFLANRAGGQMFQDAASQFGGLDKAFGVTSIGGKQKAPTTAPRAPPPKWRTEDLLAPRERQRARVGAGAYGGGRF